MTNARSLRLAAVATALAAGLASSAFAADTQSLSVTANVSGICKFQSYPAMAFTLDPSSGNPGAATSTVTYKCTKGTPAGTFDVGGVSNGATGYASGSGNALAGTGTNTDTIQYAITWTTPTAFTGSGFGGSSTAKSVTLNGAIPYANYANVAADNYSGTVAITIAY